MKPAYLFDFISRLNRNTVELIQRTGEMWGYIILLILFILFWIYLIVPCIHGIIKLSNKFLRISDIEEKWVLVTGCDSGFGKLLTKKLLENNINVFAGLLFEHNGDELRKECQDLPGCLHCVPLDVTLDESVQIAEKIVAEKLNGKGKKFKKFSIIMSLYVQHSLDYTVIIIYTKLFSLMTNMAPRRDERFLKGEIILETKS